MQTYVTLGIGQGNGDPDTVIRDAVEKVGGKFIGGYMLMGQYDYLLIFEAPDAHAAAMIVYAAKRAAGLDGKQSETLVAFKSEDFKRFGEIAEKMGLELGE